MDRIHRRSGFTLIDLLLLLALLALLVGLLLPADQQIREKADRFACTNKMRKIGVALHAMQDTFGVLAPLCVQDPTENFGSQSRSPLKVPGPYNNTHGVTIFYFLLPFLEQDVLYNTWYPDPGKEINGQTLQRISFDMYICPSEPSASKKNGKPLVTFGGANVWASSNYAANYLVFGDPPTGSTEGAAKIPGSFPDGTANTIVFAERYMNCVRGGDVNSPYPTHANLWCDANPAWRPQFCNPFGWNAKDNNIKPLKKDYIACEMFQDRPNWQKDCGKAEAKGRDYYSSHLAQNPHAEGMNVTLADGSVRQLSSKITAKTWQSATDPRDGVKLGDDW